jgi:cytochrome c553
MKTFLAIPRRLLFVGALLSGCGAIVAQGVSLGAASPPDPTAAAALKEFGVEELVFATRKVIPEHWYANFGYYANPKIPPDDNRLYRDGGRLCKLNLRTGQLIVLLDDPKGGVRDPQPHYDGGKILFSYRKGGSANYHLFEINADGAGLRQLTDGPWDDLEPSYLPDGGIVFVSSRCKRWVNCWLTQVAVLYRCDADGKNLRELSSNNEHDNTPWPLPDGRILYTRWEYTDRSQVHYHHLWVVNPDGTRQMVYFGNQSAGTVMIDAKPIPGSDKVVASFSPGHGKTEHEGTIAIVDPKAGPDAPASVRAVSKSDDFRDPWAFSENAIIAARGPSLVFMDGEGRTRQLFALSTEDSQAGYWCHEPRPLQPQPRQTVVADMSRPEQTTGRLLLNNVYDGRNMAGVERGTIKKLLVLETLPKPINYTGGMEPLSYGGTFTLERILGTVPVAADGSAYFETPALRSVFFLALDENDMAVKRMQSFVTVQPGETTGCVGCHEPRTQAPRQLPFPLAARRAPSKIEPITDVPDVFDFPRDIQPVLDNLCASCHGYDKTPVGGPRAGRLILSSDRGPMYSHSYYMMTIAALFSDGRNQPQSNYAPRTLGSPASKILKMLDGSHHGVKATAAQKKTLRLWIDSAAPYPGTYAALGTGMIGGYEQNTPVACDFDWPTTKAAAQVIDRRCAACHSEPGRSLPRALSDERGVSFWQPCIGDPRLNTSRHIVFNLTRPEKSMILLAPLAQAAGGWGLCHDPKTRQNTPVFADTKDADYQTLLAMCTAGRDHLDRIKRFDMPGFRPRPEYVREMKRYGVLPASLDADHDPIDVYDADRRYWQSFWYCPLEAGPTSKNASAQQPGAAR